VNPEDFPTNRLPSAQDLERWRGLGHLVAEGYPQTICQRPAAHEGWELELRCWPRHQPQPKEVQA
jgi:hypothetical protein